MCDDNSARVVPSGARVVDRHSRRTPRLPATTSAPSPEAGSFRACLRSRPRRSGGFYAGVVRRRRGEQ